MNAVTQNWKTTTAGALTIVGGFITFVAIPYLHGVSPNITGFLGTITAGGGLIAAHDGKAL